MRALYNLIKSLVLLVLLLAAIVGVGVLTYNQIQEPKAPVKRERLKVVNRESKDAQRSLSDEPSYTITVEIERRRVRLKVEPITYDTARVGRGIDCQVRRQRQAPLPWIEHVPYLRVEPTVLSCAPEPAAAPAN